MASSAIAAPTRAEAKAALPPYWLLAGDSTTATQSANGGGWGDGFLNKTLKNGATGHNYGHNVCQHIMLNVSMSISPLTGF